MNYGILRHYENCVSAMNFSVRKERLKEFRNDESNSNRGTARGRSSKRVLQRVRSGMFSSGRNSGTVRTEESGAEIGNMKDQVPNGNEDVSGVVVLKMCERKLFPVCGDFS